MPQSHAYRTKLVISSIQTNIFWCLIIASTIGHVRYINILTWLRGFQVKPLYLVLFSLYLKSLLGIEGQGKLEKFAILTRKPRSHAWILIYRTWPINYTGTQVTHRHFQNKGTRTRAARLSFVLKVPLCNLCPSIINSVPCDQIVQRVCTLAQSVRRSIGRLCLFRWPGHSAIGATFARPL